MTTHPAYEEGARQARETFATLKASITDLPTQALDWAPAAGVNTLAVLVRHAVAAARFGAAVAAGGEAAFGPYREGPRRQAFQSRQLTSGALEQEIDEAAAVVDRLLLGAPPEGLGEPVRFTDESPGFYTTRAGALISMLGHLREHTGQASLVRELWAATGPQHGWR